MRTFILCLIGSAIVGGGALGCGGGSDGPPDLTAYFKTTPYANAGCNAVDQRLSGQRPLRLYTNGNVALLPTTQGLASYYQRHALAFVTDAAAETTTMAYALDTDEASLDLSLIHI